MTARWSIHLCAAILCLTASAGAGAGDDWTQWGGPTRDFKVDSGRLASAWPESGPRLVWSRPLDDGYSSILAHGKSLFTAGRDGDNEMLVALEAASGKTLWTYRYSAPPLDGQELRFGAGPNATPVLAGHRLCSVGFTGLLVCVDARDGKPLWSRDLVKELGARALPFGYSSSPVVQDEMIIVLVGGERHAAAAFDLDDGGVRWTAPPVEISYASPIAIDVDGESQLVFMTPDEVVGIGAKDGRIRWRHAHANQYRNNCSGPWWGNDRLLFVSSQADGGGRTLKLWREGQQTRVEQIARSPEVRFFHNTAVRIGDYIYGSSGRELVAHNIKTGKNAWREPNFVEANVIFTGDKTILLDESGKLSLVTLTPQKLTVHASHQLLSKPAWTVPTLVGTTLYVRGKGKLLALDLSAEAGASAGNSGAADGLRGP